jgi:hypothetical protein
MSKPKATRHAALKGTRHPKPNDMMERTAIALDGIASAIRYIDLTQLDRERCAEWAASIASSLAEIDKARLAMAGPNGQQVDLVLVPLFDRKEWWYHMGRGAVSPAAQWPAAQVILFPCPVLSDRPHVSLRAFCEQAIESGKLDSEHRKYAGTILILLDSVEHWIAAGDPTMVAVAAFGLGRCVEQWNSRDFTKALRDRGIKSKEQEGGARRARSNKATRVRAALVARFKAIRATSDHLNDTQIYIRMMAETKNAKIMYETPDGSLPIEPLSDEAIRQRITYKPKK